MDKELEKELLEKVGKEVTETAKREFAAAEEKINKQAEAFQKGLMTAKEFESFKAEQLAPINETLRKLEDASRDQGIKMTSLLEKAKPGENKSIEDFVQEKAEELKAIFKQGHGFIEFTGAELKAAGINSIAGAIPTPSPYAPGISGGLEIFDIARNESFITSKIDLGRTNQARLAWANELETIEGTPSIVAEGGLKPQLQHKFSIETSQAKKIAGWIELTEEFDQDLPQFATKVRRMLQDDILRAFDDAIQVDVQAKARPYQITQLNGKIDNANYWDALNAMKGQVGYYNFVANGIGLNALTDVMLNSEKASDGVYLLPPFKDQINAMKFMANKLAVDFALVGDMKQYKVDIYKDFVMKMGWINDQFIYNKFAILGEMRFHSYISDARRNALVYDNLQTVDNLITIQ